MITNVIIEDYKLTLEYGKMPEISPVGWMRKYIQLGPSCIIPGNDKNQPVDNNFPGPNI